MSNEIIKSEPGALTLEGKRVRITPEQLLMALGPMFSAFPDLEMDNETLNAYHMMLADLEPNRLARSVVKACQEHEYPKSLITVAAIRKAYKSLEPPPEIRFGVDPLSLPPAPTKMHHLTPEEDKRQRMEQLRRYSHLDERRDRKL